MLRINPPLVVGCFLKGINMNTQTRYGWKETIINAFVIYGTALAGAGVDINFKD